MVIAGTTRRTASSWSTALYHHYTQSVSLQTSQTLARGVRTRGGLRRTPSGQQSLDNTILSEGNRGNTSMAIQIKETTVKADPAKENSNKLISESYIAPSVGRSTVQRGFPTIESKRSDQSTLIKNHASPSPRSNKSTTFKAASTNQQKQKKSIESNTDSIEATTPTNTPKPTTEKFPKRLEAFPFVPGATTSELAKAHKFFYLPAQFVKSASTFSTIPDNTLIPEVAFIGRSNIGKSSLINGLVNRNNLVKTSSKAGHTQTMNFFKVGDKLSLVDMPGYGWRSRDEWGPMILDYLKNRKNLKRIYILVDASHGLKESDAQIMKILDQSGLSYQVVLTKIDRLSKIKYKAAKAEIEAELVKDAICCYPRILGVSSKTKDGLDELRAAIIQVSQLILTK
ncbi:hypothetical protein FBU30_009796 [Linnemannia zychae]|nr:hypothetical protein FBU30_009796 [Linnemannia zychae]